MNIVRRVIKDVVDVGIEAWGFFMIGFPEETVEEMENTIKLELSLPLHRAQFGKATPLPGTNLYELWLSKYPDGQEIDWSTFHYYTFATNWAEATPEQISALQKKGHIRFFLRPKQFWSTVRHLKLYQYKTALVRLLNLSDSSFFKKLLLPQKTTA